MPTEAERAEIIAQLLKLLDEIAMDAQASVFVGARIAIARNLLRKLASPSKPDGGDGEAS